MRILWLFALVVLLNGQEGMVTVCDGWDTSWTAKDTLWSLFFLLVSVGALVGWRRIDSRIREGDELPWPYLRRWVPLGMVLSGGLLVALTVAGPSESAVAMIPFVAWTLFNLPAMVTLSLTASLLAVAHEWWLVAPAIIFVWVQWYALVCWAESKVHQPHLLSIR